MSTPWFLRTNTIHLIQKHVCAHRNSCVFLVGNLWNCSRHTSTYECVIESQNLVSREWFLEELPNLTFVRVRRPHFLKKWSITSIFTIYLLACVFVLMFFVPQVSGASVPRILQKLGSREFVETYLQNTACWCTQRTPKSASKYRVLYNTIPKSYFRIKKSPKNEK